MGNLHKALSGNSASADSQSSAPGAPGSPGPAPGSNSNDAAIAAYMASLNARPMPVVPLPLHQALTQGQAANSDVDPYQKAAAALIQDKNVR